MAQLLLSADRTKQWTLRRRLLTVLLLGLTLSGCSSVFFYPTDTRYLTPDQLELDFEEIQISTPDDELLYGWWLPAEGDARGTVYFLHGNAQNVSAHVVNVSWLPPEGYNVFLLDYRGFGASTGSPDLEGALLDSITGLNWVMERAGDTPVFVLGQSLGGSMAVLALTDERFDAETRPQGLVIDGAFAGFRMIAREKLAQSWLTWPLQAPLGLLIPDTRKPVNAIAKVEIPILIIHSQADPVVPFHHGQQLYEAATEPKLFVPTNTPHAATFMVERFRQLMLEFMARHSSP